MQTTDFLDAVMAQYGLNNDSELSRKLGVSSGAIGNYRAKRSYLSDEMALKVAHLLDVEPLTVLACVNAERNLKSGSADVFDFWANLAQSQMNKSAKMSVLHA